MSTVCKLEQSGKIELRQSLGIRGAQRSEYSANARPLILAVVNVRFPAQGRFCFRAY